MITKSKLIIILMLALIIMNMHQTARINDLQNRIHSQQYQFTELNNSINSIGKSVNRTLKNFEKEHQWIRDISFEIKDVTDDLQEMTVAISWTFNELNNDEKVFLMIEELSLPEKNSVKIDKIPIKPKSDLYYEKLITLPVKAAYNLEVLAEGNLSKRTGELEKIDLYSNLMNRIQVHGDIYGRSNQETGKIILNISLFNSNMGRELFNNGQPTKYMPDELRLKSVILEIYSNNVLVREVDMFKEGRKTGGGEPEEQFDYEITLEEKDIDVNTLRVVAKIEDNFGLQYEEDVELER